MSKGNDFRADDARGREQFAMVWKADMDSEAVRGLTGNAFRVWVALCLYANAGRGQVYPKRRTLADVLGISKRSIRRSITELEAAGLVKRHETDPQRVTLLPAPEWGRSRPGEDAQVRGEDVAVPRGEDVAVPQQQTRSTDHEQQTISIVRPAPDEWSLLRDYVATRRPSASSWTKAKGNGAHLVSILKRTGSLDRAKRLFDLAYDSKQSPHPFNREQRGGKGGHPPVSTLARNAVRYLEDAEDWQRPALRGEYHRPKTEQTEAEKAAAWAAFEADDFDAPSKP